ncbi:MAG: class I SAM-dependent methyltransferase [Planctomycetota bacterium]
MPLLEPDVADNRPMGVAFATAMLRQLTHPEQDVRFLTCLSDGGECWASCRVFLSVRREEEKLLRLALSNYPTPPRVLDIGCGIGRHLSYAIGLRGDAQVLGVEYSSILRDHCAGIIPAGTWLRSFSEVPDSERFDLVLLMGNGLGIFGSEEDAKEGLRRIYRLLANGGFLLVETGYPHGYFEAEMEIRFQEIVDGPWLVDGPFPWGFASDTWLSRELLAAGYTLPTPKERSSVGMGAFIYLARKPD